jgi:hypothetical protein
MQQALHQPRCDLCAPDCDRVLDSLSQLRAGHPRHEKLTVAQRFRQSREPGAITQIIRAHRQDDINRSLLLQRRVEEQIHTRRRSLEGVVALRDPFETEQFLELIGDDEEAVAGVLQFSRGAGQSEAARIEQWTNGIWILVSRPSARQPTRHESARQVGHGIAARPEDRDVPRRTGGRQVPSIEGRKKTRTYQRRLAAAGHSDDRHQPAPPETRQQIVALVVASEK